MRLLFVTALSALFLVVSAQEIVLTPVKPIPEAKGSSDADLELNFARGALKQSEMCGKLKGKPARINFGCEKAGSVKEVKKIWEKNEESSAWEALSQVDETKLGKDEATTLVDQIMADALGSVKIGAGKLSFGRSSPAETTGRLIFACSRLNDCLKRAFTAEERVAVADYLLSVEPVTSGVALGLKALSDFGMTSVTVQQEKNAVTATIHASTLIGQPVTWKVGKGSSSLVSATGKANEVKVTFDSKTGKVAKVPVEIELSSSLKHTLFLLFEVNASFDSARLAVKDRSNVKAEHSVGKYPAKLEKKLTVERGDVLEVSAQVTSGGSASLCPEQAAFGFVSADGLEYLVPATCSEKEIRVSIPNGAKLAEELKYTSGIFDIVFIASDDRMSNPTMWKLGQAHLSLSPPPEKKHEALFTHHLLYESDTTLKPLPEIQHQFREPDRRAPVVLAIAFSSLQVGLLLALIANLLMLGFKPMEVFKSPRVMFFSAALTIVEIVFAWYWVAPAGTINMETLTYQYLPPLLLLLLLASRHVLSSSPGPKGLSSKKTASM